MLVLLRVVDGSRYPGANQLKEVATVPVHALQQTAGRIQASDAAMEATIEIVP